MLRISGNTCFLIALMVRHHFLSRARLLYVSLFVVIAWAAPVLAEPWKGITPLKSTRSDVERVLGKPNDGSGYKMRDVYVRVYYREGLKSNASCESMVGEDVVIRIRVYPTKKKKLARQDLDLKKFTVEIDPHLLVYETYYSRELGIVYNVSRSSRAIESITYLPSAKDCATILSGEPWTD